jgi:hypothetical protein
MDSICDFMDLVKVNQPVAKRQCGLKGLHAPTRANHAIIVRAGLRRGVPHRTPLNYLPLTQILCDQINNQQLLQIATMFWWAGFCFHAKNPTTTAQSVTFIQYWLDARLALNI